MRQDRKRLRRDSGTESPPRGRRLWLFRIASVIVLPVVILALLETGLRIADVGHPAAFFVKAAERGFIQTNQFFGRRFFPASIARTPEVERFPSVKDPGTYRVFILGGSAAMGFPEPAFGVARVLESLLEEEYEGLDAEVINAAMTAVNSHVVLPVVRECARYEPDALVVYLGNNEFVGPYGPSSVFGAPGAPLPAVRVAIRVGATRTGQWLRKAARLGRAGEAPSEWRGMAMFLENQVPWGDPRAEQVYDYFHANLEDICRAGLDAGARVLLSTVAVNLADSAPFASWSPEVDARPLREWEAAYRDGAAHQAKGQYAEAVESFEIASGIYDGSADLQYRLGQCLRQAARADEARRHFARARDLDTLRFRADSRLNAMIREVAVTLRREGLALIDAEKIFTEASHDRIPGADWFYEHVHLRFSGNYLLARAIAHSLREDLKRKGVRRTGQTPSRETIAGQMALTRWDCYRMWRDIAELMQQPPFLNQLDDGDSQGAIAKRLRRQLGRGALPELKAEAARVYESALARAPGNPHLRRRYAETLDASGSPRQAAGQWRVLLEAVPDNLYWLTSLGASARESGDLDEASRAFRHVLSLDRRNAAGHFGLGSVLQEQGMLDDAAGMYEEALRLRPAYPEAENNLGLIAIEREHITDAVDRFHRAIELRPAFAEAHENMGIARLHLGQVTAARDSFRRAIDADPESGSPRYHLGASLAAEGLFSEAFPLLNEAVRLDPFSAESHHALAGVLAAKGDMEQALSHFNEAIRLKPLFAEALYNRGLLLARQGRFQAAISSYRGAVQARPEYPEAWNNMGTAYARQGNPQEAERCFEEAVRLRPGFQDARRNLANVQSVLSGR